MATPKLPAGILASDLKYPGYEAKSKVPYEDRTFDLWHVTSFGWCIPTLLISHASRRSSASTDRTYAVRVDDKSTVRIGKGPHVTSIVTVHVTNSRLKALQPFLDLRRAGAGRAGEIRDRISTRRAKGVLMRASGRSSWYWDDAI